MWNSNYLMSLIGLNSGKIKGRAKVATIANVMDGIHVPLHDSLDMRKTCLYSMWTLLIKLINIHPAVVTTSVTFPVTLK